MSPPAGCRCAAGAWRGGRAHPRPDAHRAAPADPVCQDRGKAARLRRGAGTAARPGPLLEYADSVWNRQAPEPVAAEDREAAHNLPAVHHLDIRQAFDSFKHQTQRQSRRSCDIVNEYRIPIDQGVDVPAHSERIADTCRYDDKPAMGVVVDLRCCLVADGKDEDVSATRRLVDDRVQLRGYLVPSPQLPRERRGRMEREDMNHADDQQVESDGYPGEPAPYPLGSHLRPQRRRGEQRDQIPWG